ncbi:MAG: hypothetical protein IKW92_02180 [Firmicutes bacterium]|jgi:hypothetical protein|nr:hypothetical protein [Bacillota bacterium]
MTFLERRALKKAKKKEKARKKARRQAILKVSGTLLKVLGAVTGVLFIVYFWNLDQKLLGWSYVQVNKIFDRKEADIKF